MYNTHVCSIIFLYQGVIFLSRRKFLSAAGIAIVCACMSWAETETELFTEINSACTSGSYPAVIEYCEKLEKEYPDSPLNGKAFAYKGESLFKLGRFEEAQTVLERAAELNSKDNQTLVCINYWKGRSCYSLKEYVQSAECFARSSSLFNEGRFTDAETQNCFYKSVYFAAKANEALGKTEQIRITAAYVIANGKKYSANEYNDSLKMLVKANDSLKRFEDTVSLYESIRSLKASGNAESVEPVYCYVSLYAGDAYAALGKYSEAASCYNEVLDGKKQELAAAALQKAYVNANEHSVQVSETPQEILSKAQTVLKDYPELVAEFWIRLGVESYNNGKWEEAEGYLDNALSNASRENRLLSGLYKAQIALKKNNVNSSSQSISFLDEYSQADNLTEEDIYYPDYMLAYMRAYGLAEKWNLVKKHALLVPQQSKAFNDEYRYWYALALYKTGDSKNAVPLLSSFTAGGITDTEQKEIYHDALVLKAVVLAKNHSIDQAEKILRAMDELNLLKEKEILDYAKVLLLQKNYAAAGKTALRVQNAEGWYIMAVACFNRKDWVSAEMYFKKVIASKNEPLEADTLFYGGYSQYRLGKSIEAYNTLNTFIKKYPADEYVWNACMTCANAALEAGKFDDAASQVEKAVKVSKNKLQEQQSVLLCSGIYSDAGKYEKALAVLEPYTLLSSDFAVQCRFEKAVILAKQKKIEESDELYKTVSVKFKSHPLADDAAYRRGELFYSAKNYAEAINRFEEYRRQFPKGSFIDASYFYEADCCSLLSNSERAIILYLSLINTLPKSSYVYSAKKNLMQLYSDGGEYNEALRLAENILAEFPEQSEQEGILKQYTMLKQLASGEDERIVKKRTSFENKGGLTSRKGRIEGTELASMLWKNSGYQSEAVSLVTKLLPVQSSKENLSSECSYAASNQVILAQSYRNSGDNKNAADAFLTAAQYARMADNSSLACRCLYGAVEAFDSEGLTGDTRESYELMKQLYPDDEYTKLAQHIVEGGN